MSEVKTFQTPGDPPTIFTCPFTSIFDPFTAIIGEACFTDWFTWATRSFHALDERPLPVLTVGSDPQEAAAYTIAVIITVMIAEKPNMIHWRAEREKEENFMEKTLIAKTRSLCHYYGKNQYIRQIPFFFLFTNGEKLLYYD